MAPCRMMERDLEPRLLLVHQLVYAIIRTRSVPRAGLEKCLGLCSPNGVKKATWNFFQLL